MQRFREEELSEKLGWSEIVLEIAETWINMATAQQMLGWLSVEEAAQMPVGDLAFSATPWAEHSEQKWLQLTEDTDAWI